MNTATLYLRMMQKMNEYKSTSLYEYLYKVLDKFDTPKLQCYLVACQECRPEDYEGIRVAQNILYCRNFYNE